MIGLIKCFACGYEKNPDSQRSCNFCGKPLLSGDINTITSNIKETFTRMGHQVISCQSKGDDATSLYLLLKYKNGRHDYARFYPESIYLYNNFGYILCSIQDKSDGEILIWMKHRNDMPKRYEELKKEGVFDSDKV